MYNPKQNEEIEFMTQIREKHKSGRRWSSKEVEC